jgi:MerR family Zn(II)-responsive transcriptional regulator of zntA
MAEGKRASALKIGALAARFGVKVSTLRYYEEIGLLPAARLESGYRAYSEEDAQRLRFVLKAKRAGFRLEEILTILRLGRDGKACDYVRETVARHISTLEAHIAELTALRTELLAVQARWQAQQYDAAEERLCWLFDAWAVPSLETTS